MTRTKRRVGTVLPRPEHRFRGARVGMTIADSEPDYPELVKAPPSAPNIVIVLLDDAGYGVSSAFGGLVRTPAVESLCQRGLQYCQFHTTALCAPTRASLLTGRNHHSVSSGVVAEMATGFPGYAGIIPKSCGFISEILSHHGYATGWWGKNHNVPDNRQSLAGPFENWPHRRGFDYFYGFLGGMTDQFYPALYRNTTPLGPAKTPQEGYHLTIDLADDCIAWMRAQKAIAPDRPFFVHFAPGAVHGPHQPPLAWRGRNRGRFELGWDRYREEVYRRQLELGVIAPGTQLTSRPPEIPAWDSFGAEEQQVLARQMENFADFHEHTDYEIGRLVEALEHMGEFENTLFVYMLGDNGSSAEGGLTGTLNESASMQGNAPSIDTFRGRLDELGLPGTSPHYAVGWAWAGDAPFKWVKQVASHFGGTRNGMVVTWPSWIADTGARRFQFHHVIDIVPTILDVLDIAEPAIIDGVAQKPIEGVSMAYTFDREQADAPSTHLTQYFEMLGNRAIYRDGWMACCRHGRLPWQTSGSAPFEEDRWELYNIAEDFSQAEDLAERYPDLLRELQDLFLVEAARYEVLPLDDRFVERSDVTLRPGFFTGRAVIRLAPGMTRLPEGSAPRMNNVDHVISVTADIPDDGAEGVLVCMGGDWAGWSLFVDSDRLRYHYNWYDLERYDVIADTPLPRGRIEIRLEFVCDDPQTRGQPATVRLFCNEHLVAEGRIARQVRGRFGECLDVGEDTLSPVWGGYRDRLPFRFTGRIERVELELGEAAEMTTGEVIEEQVRAD
ncbi:MAG: arylsulfatase [Kofleriaceae bacterium]|nr:arylsulfatase [Kofleriaceae bacterium]